MNLVRCIIVAILPVNTHTHIYDLLITSSKWVKRLELTRYEKSLLSNKQNHLYNKYV